MAVYVDKNGKIFSLIGGEEVKQRAEVPRYTKRQRQRAIKLR